MVSRVVCGGGAVGVIVGGDVIVVSTTITVV
jgi:hypothetical protein